MVHIIKSTMLETAKAHFYTATFAASIALDKPVCIARAWWLTKKIKRTEREREVEDEWHGNMRVISSDSPESIRERFRLRQELGALLRDRRYLRSRVIGPLDPHYREGVIDRHPAQTNE